MMGENIMERRNRITNPKNTYSLESISQRQYGTFTQLKSKIDPV